MDSTSLEIDDCDDVDLNDDGDLDDGCDLDNDGEHNDDMIDCLRPEVVGCSVVAARARMGWQGAVPETGEIPSRDAGMIPGSAGVAPDRVARRHARGYIL